MNLYKIIKILIFFIILVLLLSIYVLFKNKILDTKVYDGNKTINSVDYIKNEIESNEYYYDELIETVVRRNQDWDTLPLTEHFKNKFKNDIFDIEILGSFANYSMSSIDRNREKCIMTLDTTEKSGERWHRKIHYIYNDKYELDDMQLIDSKLIVDSSGNYFESDTKYIYSNSDSEKRSILVFLFMPFIQGKHDKYETTSNFILKFPEVADKKPIKIDRNYLFIDNLEMHDDKFNIWVYDEINHYEYEIEILTDDNGAIDDMKYKYIRAYEGDVNNIQHYNDLIEEAMSNER